MSTKGKVVINLATGLEDPERVTVAFLVAGAAAQAGKEVTMFMTKEAVRLALPNVAQGIACDGCPTLPTLATQYAEAGGRMPHLPNLLQRAQAQRGRADRRRAARRRDPAVAVDRRRRDRV
jgi:hypothetical protein